MQPTLPDLPARLRDSAFSYLSLFTSLGTLLCCALPSLLVLVGLGAGVASFLADAPWLVTMSRHKQWVFMTSGILIAANFLYIYVFAPRLQAGREACDPGEPSACQTASRVSRVVLWSSAALYLTGAFSAFLLGPILVYFDL